MRVVLLSESLRVPSGFGNQARLLSTGLAQRGHEIYVISSSGAPVDRKEYGTGFVEELRLADLTDVQAVDRLIHKLQPDAVICFWFLWMLQNKWLHLRSTVRNCPTFFWLAWEGQTLPKDYQKFSTMPDGSLVHLSQFSADLWKDVVPCCSVIPHALDPVFEVEPTEREIHDAKEWFGERFKEDSAGTLLNVDRNTSHKNWDATFAIMAELKQRLPVKLVAHTRILPDNGTAGYDILNLAKYYGVEKQLITTNFNWSSGMSLEDLRRLYLACDVRISTSSGEGFGIPCIEAGALRKSQVVNGCSNLQEFSEFATVVRPNYYKNERDSYWGVPDVSAMAAAIERHLRDRTIPVGNFPKAAYSLLALAESWENRLTGEYPDAAMTHRWGYVSKLEHQLQVRDLAVVVAKLGRGTTAFEVGSFDGEFIRLATEAGVSASGIEFLEEALDRIKTAAKISIRQDSYDSNWDRADCLILTDVIQAWFLQGGKELIEKLLRRCKDYKWTFVRCNEDYDFGKPLLDASFVKDCLKLHGMSRRQDLEKFLREKHPHLAHEIWTLETNSDIPVGWIK